MPTATLPQPRPALPATVGVNDVATLLGCNRATVYRNVAAGKFPRPMRLGQLARWFKEDVINFMRNLAGSNGLPLQPA